MTFPKPGVSALRTAFSDHGVRFVEHRRVSAGRSRWSNGLRAVVVHHTAGKNSADYLATHWSLPGANCVINNGRYNGTANDGRAVVLSWGDAWHSGDGGPWSGVAGKNSLHLVAWGIEIESLGSLKDISDKQVENVGRMLAALVDMGVPLGNVVRHADWTDGTGGVSSTPLPTLGRKIDTRKEWYPTSFWRKQAREHAKPDGYWDGKVPDYDAVMTSMNDDVANPASWRLACLLADKGFYRGEPRPKGQQSYPRKAVANWQESRGYKATGTYGPKAHELLWPKG